MRGAQPPRAVENFPISGLRFPRSFIRALGLIKSAAARFHKLPAIEKAADEGGDGLPDDQFVADIFQTGSGTSTNMNANEVIAHLAGAHPNDDVNRGMSSNDAIPSAIHIAAAETIHANLFPAMRDLESSLNEKAREFDDIVKTGRTH